jgi:hypothetical protein
MMILKGGRRKAGGRGKINTKEKYSGNLSFHEIFMSLILSIKILDLNFFNSYFRLTPSASRLSFCPLF